MRCNKILVVIDLFIYLFIFRINLGSQIELKKKKKNLYFEKTIGPTPFSWVLYRVYFILMDYNHVNFFFKFRAFLVRRPCNIPLNTEDLNDTCQHFCLKCCKCSDNRFCSIPCQETWLCFNNFVWVFFDQKGTAKLLILYPSNIKFS